MGEARGPRPPLFWVKKEEITAGQVNQDRPPPPPNLAQGLDPPLGLAASRICVKRNKYTTESFCT